MSRPFKHAYFDVNEMTNKYKSVLPSSPAVMIPKYKAAFSCIILYACHLFNKFIQYV